MALPTLITTSGLRKKVPFSQQHINRLEAKGEFPQRVRIGPQKVAWIESEVEDWLASRERGVGPAPNQWTRWRPSRSTDSAGLDSTNGDDAQAA